MRFLPMSFCLFAVASPALAGPYLNVAGDWHGALIDDDVEKPCDTDMTIEQSDTELKISAYTYICQERSEWPRSPINATIEPLDDQTGKVMVDGAVIGIIRADYLRININLGQQEALEIKRNGQERSLRIRENVRQGDSTHSLQGILRPAF